METSTDDQQWEPTEEDIKLYEDALAELDAFFAEGGSLARRTAMLSSRCGCGIASSLVQKHRYRKMRLSV